MFSDAEFEEACASLENPNFEGWEFFVESKGVTIYRNYRESSGLYEYKVIGTMEGVTPDVCAKVYVDLDYRKQWDSYVSELREITEDEKTGIYWNVNYPFPLSNRDYTFIRESREFDRNGKHIWVILGRSENFKSIPEKSGVIRVDDFLQSLAITADGENISKAYMHYYDNPKGLIPTWLINWAAKTGVPAFLDSMTKACMGYKEYQEKKITQH